MENLSKSFVNEEGETETIVASSDDNYKVNLDGKYVLSNHEDKKDNKLVQKFKGSFLGADIGVKSRGFSSVAILATVLSLAVLLVLYFCWRF